MTLTKEQRGKVIKALRKAAIVLGGKRPKKDPWDRNITGVCSAFCDVTVLVCDGWARDAAKEIFHDTYRWDPANRFKGCHFWAGKRGDRQVRVLQLLTLEELVRQGVMDINIGEHRARYFGYPV